MLFLGAELLNMPEVPRGKMQKRRLGRTRKSVSVVSFGGGVIGGERLPDAFFLPALNFAADLGVNFWDTAASYGRSEARIGQMLKGRGGDNFIVCTKVPSPDRMWTKDLTIRAIERSRELIGIKTLDIVLCHGVRGKDDLDRILAPGGALDGLKECRKRGWLEFTGLSGGHNSWELETMVAAITSGEFDVAFPSYNIEFTDAAGEGNVFETAQKADVGVMVKKAFTPQPPWRGRQRFQQRQSMIQQYGAKNSWNSTLRTSASRRRSSGCARSAMSPKMFPRP
jgi:aryl-alcohol dehydrogenase-like predicted oxidoreductase